MNKRIFLVFGIILLMVMPIISAANILDTSTWDDKVTFHEEGKSGKYGYYEIEDTTFWFFNNRPVKTIELLENEYSILTAYNIKEIEMFRNGKLFDRSNYYARDKKTDKSNVIKSEQHLYRQLVNITKTIPVQGDCTQFNTITNGTTGNQSTYCIDYEDLSYDEVYEDWTEWEEYNWHSVTPGLYQTKTIVTRTNQYTGMVDWIDTSEGHKLKEWAAWWDSSWSKKREISSLNGTISALYVIDYNDSMQSDFGDLRFLDIATESTELNYVITDKNDGVNVSVRIDIENETEVMMYYGNGAVSTTSNGSDTFLGAVSYYPFDDKTTNDFAGTNDGSTSTATWTNSGRFGGGYTFDGNNDVITIPDSSSLDITTEITLSAWIYPTATQVGGQTAIVKLSQSSWAAPHADYYLGLYSSTRTVNGWVKGPGEQLISAAQVTLNAWNHIAFTYDGTTEKIYINGIQDINTKAVSGSISTSVYDLLIGSVQSSIYFNGDIDEPMIHDYAFTPAQMSYIYQQGLPNFVVGAEQTNVGTSLTQLQPANGLTTDEITNYFAYNITTDGLNFTNTSLSIWNDTDDTLYLSNFTSLSGNTSQIINWTNTLTDGFWKWNAEVCDSSDNCVSGENRTLIIHTVFPAVNIINPIGDISYFKLGENETLTWSVTENTTNLTEHIIECIYEYNGTIFNITDICITTNSTNFTYIDGANDLTLNVTDFFGLVASNTTTWQYEILEKNITFLNTTSEGSLTEFSIFLDTLSPITNAKFVYNGTAYTSNIFNLGGNSNKLVSTITVPAFENDSNVTFYFNVTTQTNPEISTSNQTQLVLILEISNCSTFNNSIMNISLFNERTLVDINGTIEFNMELFNAVDNSLISNIFTSFSNVHTAEVCSNLNFSRADFIYDLELRYYSGNLTTNIFSHIPEFYHIQKASVSNFPQLINLYDLNVNESTEFTIFFRDDNYIARENVLLNIQRKYVDEGVFRTIEIPITSSEGSAVGHFDLNNYKYKITVTDDGELLSTFDNPSIRCESEISGICTISIKGSSSVSSAEYSSDLQNFFYTVSQENDSIIVAYTIPSGESESVNVEMVQTSPFKDPESICNTTLLSSAGQIECTINATIGDSNVDIRISSNDDTKANLRTTFQEDLNTSFLLQNYFIASILMIFLVTMFVTSTQIMIFVSIFGVVYLGLMFLLKSTSVGLLLGAITWLIVAGVIVISKLTKKAEE